MENESNSQIGQSTVRSIFKDQAPMPSSQGISSAKNATSHPIMFPNNGSMRQPHVFPTLN